jgi:hypothetical protein
MNTNNYGYAFNNIEIRNDIVVKSAKNDYGKNKIQYEIEFYKYIIANQVSFPIPTIISIDSSNAVFTMEYLQNHSVATFILRNSCSRFSICSPEKLPIQEFVPSSGMATKITNRTKLITSILSHLHSLHSCSTIAVSKDVYIKQLHIETKTKILDRYNDSDWNTIWSKYNITHVNNIKIHNKIEYYIQKINQKIYDIIDSFKEYYFTIIHGDAHLGNILLLDNDIRFIDPRGYFGDMKLYGIKEYDSAKLLFGLSGYSYFNEITIENIHISEGNVEIDFIDNYSHIYNSPLFSKYEKLLSLTIWLGNNSMFSSESKKVYSIIIAYYICEKYM